MCGDIVWDYKSTVFHPLILAVFDVTCLDVTMNGYQMTLFQLHNFEYIYRSVFCCKEELSLLTISLYMYLYMYTCMCVFIYPSIHLSIGLIGFSSVELTSLWTVFMLKLSLIWTVNAPLSWLLFLYGMSPSVLEYFLTFWLNRMSNSSCVFLAPALESTSSGSF